MEYEQRDLFTHLPCGRGAACTEVRQQTFPDEMTDSIGLQLFFNCAYIVADKLMLFEGLVVSITGTVCPGFSDIGIRLNRSIFEWPC